MGNSQPDLSLAGLSSPRHLLRGHTPPLLGRGHTPPLLGRGHTPPLLGQDVGNSLPNTDYRNGGLSDFFLLLRRSGLIGIRFAAWHVIFTRTNFFQDLKITDLKINKYCLILFTFT